MTPDCDLSSGSDADTGCWLGMTLDCDLMELSSPLSARMTSSSSRILASLRDSGSWSPVMLTRDGVLNISEGEVLSGERERVADMVLSPGPSSAWDTAFKSFYILQEGIF